MTQPITDFPIHTSVAVSDLDQARTWYHDKLGLKPDQEDQGGFWYRFAGDTWLHVFKTESAGTAQNTVAGITVDSIEDIMDHLRSRGVEFEHYDYTENGLATWQTAKTAWFKDPDGNTYELSQTL